MSGNRNIRSTSTDSSYHLIWQTVSKIPKGKVATYGQIARLSGFPGQARLVGYALHNLPLNIDVPWHRVVNARGMISFPKSGHSYQRQKELLENDGIEFQRGRIDLGKYGWKKSRSRGH